MLVFIVSLGFYDNNCLQNVLQYQLQKIVVSSPKTYLYYKENFYGI